MGATVTTGRMAAAFRTTNGTTIYCLYERTYEKNCYPHTPHWSAVYVGDLTGAFQTIFNYASSCEGGMLQNRSGALSPEGYLRTWMSRLQAPVRMTQDIAIDLYVKNDSMYAPLSDETMPAVALTLSEYGMQDTATQLQAGEKILISLFDQGELISQLHKKHRIPAWLLLREFTRPWQEDDRDTSLGIPRTRTVIDAPEYRPALVISQFGDMLLQEADGTWRCHGGRWEIMSSYIHDVAAIEQTHPGNYHCLIQSYRNYLKSAPKADRDGLLVQTDKRLANDQYQHDRIEEASALPGATINGNIVTIPFSEEHAYELIHLPRKATIWRVQPDNDPF